MSGTLLLSSCPCGSQKKFTECCEPIISGKKIAASPEALMRSRYTAFTLSDVDYLFATMTPELVQHTDREEMQDFADDVTQWLGLEIISAPPVASNAIQGNVEFIANFKIDGEKQCIHEQSEFTKKDGQWLYSGHQHQCSSHDDNEHEHHHDHENCDHDHDHDHEHHHHHQHGENCNHDYHDHSHHQQPFIANEKIGRNDLCPCGSGRKYKKCCID